MAHPLVACRARSPKRPIGANCAGELNSGGTGETIEPFQAELSAWLPKVVQAAALVDASLPSLLRHTWLGSVAFSLSGL